ncbi:hypothetical protein GL213_14140 [Halogeometricum borinquense]|uniref:Small CPxCG-related zinc finger protein n=1 Tax=Halogeometricum borinquense TaxID=60847 RepID=A0A6C0UGW9_9EURY|nr:DUF6276 family protein [Halogeometricum borinquense]QIB73039.1 hypothetical protein G3I44_01310 [Halogeometricum borinquense]QIQ77562.1 hypothetical protein GL213_14140 [Halogeometricum borinquense]
MNCTYCDDELVVFAVPDDLREFAPDGGTASLCTTCLRLDVPAADAEIDEETDFTAVSDAFPSGRGGIVFALFVGKLDSLALNRSAIEELAVEAERAGADPFLALDRLGDDQTVDPHFDFERRRRQIESFLS